MADVADGAASAAGPAVDAGTTAAAGSYESAVKAAGMDAVHTELAFSVWEPQTTIPPKRVSVQQECAFSLTTSVSGLRVWAAGLIPAVHACETCCV